MTDTYNDTTGSKKKFLIPLVVLLLCAVSLTGAGYAYNSTVTTANEHADSHVFSINTYEEDGETVKMLPFDEANKIITFTTATTYQTVESVTSGTTIVSANAADAEALLLGYVYFKVTNDKEVAAATDVDDNVYVQVSAAIDVSKVTSGTLTSAQIDAVKALKDNITLSYKVWTTADTPAPVNKTGNDYVVAENTLYKAEVYAVFTGEATPVGTHTGVDTDPTVLAVVKYYEAAFNLYEYNVTVSASDAATN